MPEQNRVTPLGEIVASPLRGAWTGNRGGVLHDDHRRIRRTHASTGWIVCALTYGEQRVRQWQPDHYTPLFFHDEAVALAAGHRPCALCRRAAYTSFREAWQAGNEGPLPSAAEINARLHAERVVPFTRRPLLHDRPWAGLPDGAFVRVRTGAALVLGDRLAHWTADEGYVATTDRPRRGTATVLTPPSTLGALGAGYRPQVDPSATDS